MAARNINVNLWANTSGFVKGFNNAQKTFSGFVSVFQAGIAALGLSKLAAEFHEVAMGVDDVADNAAKLGITAQSFEALSFAAERFNVSQQAVTASVQKMLVNVGKGGEVFSKLGLSIDEIKDLSPDEIFARTSTALSQVSNFAQRAALAQEAFGRGGKELLGAISSGELADVIARAKELNSNLTGEAVKNADAYANAIQELSASLENLKRAIIGTEGFRRLIEAVQGATELLNPSPNRAPQSAADSIAQQIAKLNEEKSALQDRMQFTTASDRWKYWQEEVKRLSEIETKIGELLAQSRAIIQADRQKASADAWLDDWIKTLGRNRVESAFMAPADALRQLPDILGDAGRQFDVLVSKAQRFADIAGFKSGLDRDKIRAALGDQAAELRQQIAEAEAARVFDTADAIAGIGSPSAMTRGSSGNANFFANLQAEMRGRKASENYLKENNMTAKRQLTELERMRQRLDDIEKRIAMIPTENYN